ncbi:MAG: ATP-binding protein [Fidelibacterota bacterium]
MNKIRKKALEILDQREEEKIGDLSRANINKTVHELKVHQIELELQNEELIDLQREMEESRNHYYDLFNNAPVGYIILDKSGKILDVNDTFLKLLDYVQDDMVDKYFVDFLDADSRNIFGSRFKAIFKKPSGKILEVCIQKGNRRVYVELKGEKIKYPKEKIDDHLVFSVADVSERRESRRRIIHLNRILESVRKINRLIAQEKDITTLLNESVTVLSNVRGYTNVWIALYDKNFERPESFFYADETQKIRTIKEMLQKEEGTYCINEIKQHKGVLQASYDNDKCTNCPICEKGLLYCSYTARLEYKGEIFGIISAGLEFGLPRSEDEKKLFTEIVDDLAFAIYSFRQEEYKQQLMKELKEERDLIGSILNTTPSGITFVNKEGQITYGNEVAKKILNVDELNGQLVFNDPKFKITDLDDNPFPDENLPFTIVKKTHKPVYNLKHAIRRGSGEKVVLSVSATPKFDSRGKFDGMISIIRDITRDYENEKERIRLGKMVNRSQKLETIGTLAGGIAHDFNNILTPILGYADMVLNAGLDSEFARDNIEEIYKASVRAKDLVAQILSFSRHAEQDRQPIYVNTVVNEALKLLRSTIPTTINIIAEVDKECPKILGDASKIHQVVVNLCTNAYQAMEDEGGTLFVDLKTVEIKKEESLEYLELKPGQHINITIKDTGIGMDNDTLDKIFEPFFTTRDVNKGTGLGLSVVHGIVKSHEGTIIVDSEVGKGTEFNIYFPVIDSNNEKKIEEIGPLEEGHEKILLVDDKETVTKMISKFLGTLGYSVISVNSSIKALELYSSNPKEYDLLITDLTMPEMTGYTLAQKIHDINENFPILMMTGYGAKITREEQQAVGIKKIISKPILIDELSQQIREMFDEFNHEN